MRLVVASLLMLSMFFLSSCKKEEPNPELLDPIYTDLDRRASEAQKGLEDEIKHRDELRVQLTKAEPNTIDQKNAQRDLVKSERTIDGMEQRARYYKIRAKRRAIVDKITYGEAFAKNKPWPDPREYPDYLVNIRLNEVNLNWNSRVPKLQSRLEKPKEKKEEKAKAEE